MKKITIGARGSRLSLIQTEIVKTLLKNILPEYEINIEVITTTGDKNLNPVPLDSIGKGWFTKEIDKALIEKRIDLAVHSLKDLPETLETGLILASVPQREDAREVMVSKQAKKFNELERGTVIGTDSFRRSAQILYKRPDLKVKSIRGNVNTRLEKLKQDEYGALFLAAAGLKRLGLEEVITQYFDTTEFIPSPGQGALAVVARGDDETLLPILKRLNHIPTLEAVASERHFAKSVGGGCKTPIGAYARIIDDKFKMEAFIGASDGSHFCSASIEGKRADSIKLSGKLAKTLLDKSTSWYRNDEPK